MNIRLNAECMNAIEEIKSTLSDVTAENGTRIEPSTMDLVTAALISFAAEAERSDEGTMDWLVSLRLQDRI